MVGNVQERRAVTVGGHLRILGLVAVVVVCAHGPALTDGLFLDDHWHQVRLREASWRVRDLIASTTIEPARWLHAWWQERQMRWDYARPVTMAWMKAVQQAAGGSVALQHLAGLLLHTACCVLVYVLCVAVTRHGLWSAFAAVLFAVYPHHAYTVGWLAAQNAVLQAVLGLAAVLCYWRASGLQPPHGRDPLPAGVVPPLSRGWFAVAVLLFCGSMLARENAVILPLLFMAFDGGFGGREHWRARWRCHALLAALAVAFALWRLSLFDSRIPEVYLRRPQDGGYGLWLLAKFLHYLVCVIWEAPMLIGPTRHVHPWQAATGDCLLMLVIAVVLGGGFFVACRRIRGYWVWAAWIVLAIAPVLPILATPHSAYMAAVGFAVAVVLKPATVPAGRARLSTVVALWMLMMSIFAFTVYRLAWRGVQAAERLTIAQILADDPPPPGTEVFLINLPLINIYLPINLQQGWGLEAEALRCHVLTFAPHLLAGPQLAPPARLVGTAAGAPAAAVGRFSISQLDARSFVLQMDGRRFFDGLLGEFLTRAMRRSGSFTTGAVVRGPQFDVHIADAGPAGVQRLRFTFHRPLSDPRFRFYAITEDCPGARVHFSSDEPMRAEPPTLQCADFAGRNRLQARRQQTFRILQRTRQIIQTDLYLSGSQ